jgi:hypothetical protein
MEHDMAHIIGMPRPDVGFSRDVDGGAAWLMDFRSHEWVELSLEASAVLEIDSTRRDRALARVRGANVVEAAEATELEVRLHLAEGQALAGPDRRALFDTLAQLAIDEWLEQQEARS